MTQPKPTKCPCCRKNFHSRKACGQHMKAKHPGEHLGPDPDKDHSKDDDMSLAEIAVEAELKRRSGLPLDPLERSLLV